MKGFSVRNLKYMRRFAEVRNEGEIVQQVAAQLRRFHNCVLLEKLADMDERIWYARAAIHHGWSGAVLCPPNPRDARIPRESKAISGDARAKPSISIARSLLPIPTSRMKSPKIRAISIF
jgi:hypothetical protein